LQSSSLTFYWADAATGRAVIVEGSVNGTEFGPGANFNITAPSPATPTVSLPTNGQLSIPLSQVSDGDLHRFEAKENGVTVRFWLYQKPDGKVATVFDACQICGPVGFYKGPNGVVCKNCAAPINGQSVGMTGGCNPIPLHVEQSADAVTIRETDVAASAHIFQQ